MDTTKVMKFKRTLKTAAAVFKVLIRFRVGRAVLRSRQDKTLTNALSCLAFFYLYLNPRKNRFYYIRKVDLKR